MAAAKILYIFIALCTVKVIRGPLSPLELTRKSFIAQKEWRVIWDKLIALKEIQKTTYPNQSGTMVDMYKFNGEDVVSRMKLSDAFKLLQNWNQIEPEGGKQKFFELNIGGEDYIFRLAKDKNNQIMVYDEKGAAPKYNDIFNYFQAQESAKVTTQEAIAKEILRSTGEELGSQTPFSFGSAKELKKRMRDLMVVGQVAEAASMSDESFYHMEEKFHKVELFYAETRNTFWKSETEENFNNENRKIYTTNNEYENLFKLSEELRVAPPDKKDELKDQIAKALPEPSDAFFEGLENAAGDTDRREETEKVVEKLGVEKLTDEQYNNIKEATDILLTSTDETEKANAKKTILDNIPELTDEYYNALMSSSENCEANADHSAREGWKKFVKTKFEKDGVTIKKVGRVPGQDYLFRHTISVIASDTEKAGMKKKFTELFEIHLKGGTGRARIRLYGDQFKIDVDILEEAQASLDQIIRDIKAAAVGEETVDTIEDAIDDVLGASGCSRMVYSNIARSSICERKNMKIIEDTFEWEGDVLSFETINEDGIRVKNNVNIDMENMGLPKYVDENIANLEELGVKREELDPHPPSGGTETASKAIGIYGSFVGILSSAKYLQMGEYGQATFSAFQSVYTIGGLSGLNRVLEEASEMALAKLMGFTADKVGVEKAMERMIEMTAKLVGETASRVLNRVAGSLPIIGLAFDLYFVAEDIKDLQDKSSDTPYGLKIAHLVLDVSITTLSLIESLVPEAAPFTEPVIIALTIVRISIDDFYMDIKRELSRVSDKGFGAKVDAFVKGFDEGFVDFLTLGLFTQVQALQEQVDFDHELLANMSDPAKYFEYRFDNSQGDLDFTSGVVSEYGGFLDVKLHNDGKVTMTMAEVPDENGLPQTITKTFDFYSPIDDIILGIGETQTPLYMQETAYLWMFIPVKSDDVIADLDQHGSSRYGVYTGNNMNNTFYAIQTQADPTKAQTANRQIIGNELLHKRFMRDIRNVNSQRRRMARRNSQNSNVFATKRSTASIHAIETELDPSNKHTQNVDAQVRKIHNNHDTNDFSSGLNNLQSTGKPIASPFAYSESECDDPNGATNISLYLKSYNYNLYGKDGDDKFFLGPQQTLISGDNGKDLYYIQPSGGKTIIDNFAIDDLSDTLYFNVSFNNIKCNRDDWDLVIGFCDTHLVRLKHWFNHEQDEFYQHIYIISNDGIIMEATESEINSGKYSISCGAVIVDKTGSSEGQEINMIGRFSHVKDAYGSNYSDIIIGNELGNLISPGSGHDLAIGKGGKDVYVIDRGDGMDVINNYAEDSEEDTIIFSVLYTNIVAKKNYTDLILFDKTTERNTLTIQQWFSSSLYQHASFLSKDYVQFTVELNSTGGPLLIALTIDLSYYTHGVRIDLNDSRNNQNYSVNSEQMKDVKVIFDSPYNDSLVGNALGNFFTCRSGFDFLKGNSGKDTYIADVNCSDLVINNFDDVKDMDLLLIRCKHDELSLENPSSNPMKLVIVCMRQGKRFEVQLFNWFAGLDFQHLYIKTDDLVTSFPPSNTTEFQQSKGKLIPVELQFNRCEGLTNEINIRAPEYSKVERVEANNVTCSYSIFGNHINNYMDPGPGNPFGMQYMEGGNGTDVYVLGHNYGMYNIINNFAEDNQTDHLRFGVIYHDIVVQRDGLDVNIRSKSQNDSVEGVIVNYFADSVFQHLVVETADHFMFRFTEEYPYIEVIMVDLSTSKFSQVVSPHENTSFKDAIIVIGSKTAENRIEGGLYSKQIIGGNQSDTILGGPGDEDIVGFKGADFIRGGEGNDRIYGGDDDDILYGDEGDDSFFAGVGSDKIYGGNGSDFIVFSGVHYSGVSANLQVNIGMYSDAENDTYHSIESILASEFEDLLIGNNDNNILRSYDGDDTIYSYAGFDLLHGGTGSDLYMLDEASGPKVINNFATDEALDMVSLKNYSSSSVCYFYLEEDLIMNIPFDQNNQDTIGRVITAEDFLEITVALALKNTTYQHLLFYFSDVQMYIEEFIVTGNQIGAIYSQVYSGYFLHITCHTETTICININYTAINVNDAPPEKYTLELVHVTYNDTVYSPLSYIYNGGSETIELNNLQSGVENTFFAYQSSCDLSVTFSPLLSVVTIPNPPVNLEIDAVFYDGFQIHWDSPSNYTDPLVGNYSYVIKIILELTNEIIQFETNDTVFLTASLLPQTEYKVLVYSKSLNTTSRDAVGLHLTTDSHTCKNLNDLPETMYIHNFDRSEQDLLIANLSCIQGYRLIGNPNVVCDDMNAVLPICDTLECYIPTVENATLLTDEFNNDTNIPLEGDQLIWECDINHEVSAGITMFNSTCYFHTWAPPPGNCELLPQCHNLYPPADGTASASEIFVGESVSYNCNHGFALVGPMMKHCIRTDNGSLDLIPHEPSECERTHCPSLIPQDDGSYSKTAPYYEDVEVLLSCYFGFYVSNRFEKPQNAEYLCINSQWNETVELCKTMIATSQVVERILVIQAEFTWSFSAWDGVAMNTNYYNHGCLQIGGTKYDMTLPGGHIQCERSIYLANGPSDFEGILAISDREEVGGESYVCIDSTIVAEEICDSLGYSDYTASIYSSNPITTTKALDGNSIHSDLTNTVKDCTTRISCKARCDPLDLLNGEGTCPHQQPSEGDKCTFRCNNGYYLIGDNERQCTLNGWTGVHTFCDGKQNENNFKY